MGNTRLVGFPLGEHLDHELIFKFFATFSRFEYALKRANFRKPGAKNEPADPDWDAFALKIAASFGNRRQKDGALDVAIDVLVADPPKKQTHDMRWIAVEPQGDPAGAPNVLLMVRRIRNNLFHGGKARAVHEVERDNILVKNALVVLDHALACDDDVRGMFEER